MTRKTNLKAAIRMAVAMLLACSWPVCSHADITTDGTMGAVTNLAGPDYAITEGLGTRTGNNLFHSFVQFNIGTGESATFSGTQGIENILGRVTGGSRSNIDGTVRSTIPGANLYLVNPAGIMFGDNASIEVDGSFHASTADYIRLGNDGHFDASMPANTILTKSPPAAFGFLGAPAGISVDQSTLEVPVGKSLSLVGGSLDMQNATLLAPGGQIQIAGVASPGEALITTDGIDTTGFSQMADVEIRHTGNFYTRPLANLDTSSDSGGVISIRAGRFVMDNGYIFADNVNGAGGRVDIEATESVSLSNESIATADTFGSGSGGAVVVRTGDVVLKNGGIFQTDNYGPGSGGTVDIHASGALAISGRSPAGLPYIGDIESGLNANTFGTGSGGTIDIDATVVTIGDGGKIAVNSTFRGGDAGSLNLSAQTLQMNDGGIIQTDTFGAGNAGTVSIDVERMQLDSGSTVAATTRGAGNGGTITITADDTVSISGSNNVGPSGIFTNSFNEGNGGTIQISANRLSVTDGGGIQSAVSGSAATPATQAGNILIDVADLDISGQGQISTQSDNAGQAGYIQLTAARRINISSPDAAVQSGVFSTATSSGDGGNISLGSAELYMDGGAINVSSSGTGNAGNIAAQLDRLEIQGGGQLSTSVAGTGTGGDIVVNANDSILLSGNSASGFNSGLYSITQGDGAGGNILLSARNVMLDGGSLISAESMSLGNAGNINLNATDTVTIMKSSIQTNALIADGGNIDVNSEYLVYLLNSEVTSSVGTGFGNGGNISIDPEFVILNNSNIVANAYGGAGGNILIVAENFIASSDSTIDASSALGIDGTVVIKSPDTDLGSSLSDLPESFLNVSALLREPCEARKSLNQSSFIVHGRRSIPAGPDLPLPTLRPSLDISTDAAGLQIDDNESVAALQMANKSAGAKLITECSF